MKITVENLINVKPEIVWQKWTNPEDIKQWNAASDDWHTTYSEVDLRVDGRFVSTMAAKDGSMQFDFSGTYTQVEENKLLEFRMDDDRMVSIVFEEVAEGTLVKETFESEDQHSADMQRDGWQAILNNFKRHVESK